MKYLVFVIVILLTLYYCFSGQSAKAQNTFELMYGNSDWCEFISDSEEDALGNYYLTGHKYEPGQGKNWGFVLKISPGGEIIHEINFFHPDTSYNIALIYRLNDLLYIFGSKGQNTSSNENLIWSAILDTSLNIIKSREYYTEEGLTGISVAQAIYPGSGNFILLLNAFPVSEITTCDIGLFEMTSNLDSTNFRVDHKEANQIGFSILRDEEENEYKVFCFGYYPDSYPNYSELVKFDSAFNYLSVDSIGWQLIDQFSAKPFDESTYLLAGKKGFVSPNKRDVGITRSTNDDLLLLANHFGKSGDTSSYAAVTDGIDFISKNNIYLGGTSNLLPLHYPWQAENSWIMLNILDSTLQLKSQMFYGGDAFYLLNGLKATNDGGCLMYAERYDENTQFEEYDVYILKVDSSGLLTSSEGDYNIPVQQLNITPNPASDFVSVLYPDIFGNDEKKIIIYNLLGTPVMNVEATNELSEIRIDIEALPGGLYFVLLNVNGKKAAMGKFLIRN